MLCLAATYTWCLMRQNQCRHNLESMNRELKRGIEDTQQQVRHIVVTFLKTD